MKDHNNIEGYDGYGVSSSTLDPYYSHRRGKGGVAILFKENLKHSITMIDIDADWICGITLSLDNRPAVHLFSVYMPCSNYSNITYSECIEQLHDICNQYSESSCIFLGDFNAEMNGEKCHKTTYQRGDDLSEFVNHYLKIKNGKIKTDK